MKTKTILVFFILLAQVAFPVFASDDNSAMFNPAIRIDQRVDAFVNRIHARYGVLPAGAFRQPMETATFLSYLDSLENLPLTNQERYSLNGLRNMLSLDRKESEDARWYSQIFNNGIYGFHNREEEYGIIINLDLTADAWVRSGGDVDTRWGGRGVIGPSLRGYIGNFSFYSGLEVWSEYVYDSLFFESSYQPYDGIPYNVYGERDNRIEGGNIRVSDIPRAGVAYNVGRIHLETAIDYLRLGPAVHYPLTLSGFAPPITYARATFDLTRVEYFHIAGILRSQKDKTKYIYANGLRGSFLNNKLQVGISEVMINGSTTNQQDNDPDNAIREGYKDVERTWEWAYLIPFVPMVFVEHYVGDRDNAALSFDFTINAPKNFRFYGEFFLDDIFSPWEIFSDDWGNKWAVTLGAQYFTHAWGRDFESGIEWSRVEPWVYTHFYGGSHRYDHFDTPLGNPLGPNSMAVAAHCGVSVAAKTTLGLTLTSLQNNPTTRGGNITDIFQDGKDSEKKKFLGKGTVHHLRPGIYGSYDPFGFFRVNAAMQIDVAEDKGSVYFTLDGGFRF